MLTDRQAVEKNKSWGDKPTKSGLERYDREKGSQTRLTRITGLLSGPLSLK